MSVDRLLRDGGAEILGQVQGSSNYTFLVELTSGGESCWGIFKPEAGEQYLHDFPPGLWRRERAAYLLSENLGWSLVPPTVVRALEPLGVGSLQLYVDNDGSHYFPLYETRADLHPQLLRLAVFDLLVNNTDRKSGHVLLGEGDRVWGIDQGLCFHQDPKLRTVIWDFAHETIPAELVSAVEPLVESVPKEVASLLTEAEAAALQSRASRIVRLPWLPEPQSEFPYPWPLV
ncbi:SCO1664 family protein [Corynebacterium sp. Marseille-P4321]|uniref:SCO1664 family protein n=1 Tax=Corynebacterium sp. Marseille-P4321 TaxID=2736603 RepID=UPI000893A2FF|nr:SCO1664 family protein [Corynebacterium sp. Marseille-P4321]OEY13509.1 phosphatidylinositol kinase [Corynebacterium sp. BCW_4722]